MAVIMGIDYGDRRIGIAACDEFEMLATPRGLVEWRAAGEDVKGVLERIASIAPERLVVGLPLSLSGAEGPAAVKVRDFMRRLALHTNLPMDAWDERFSSTSAHQALGLAGVSSRKRKGKVDPIAAQILLQNYLDARDGPP